MLTIQQRSGSGQASSISPPPPPPPPTQAYVTGETVAAPNVQSAGTTNGYFFTVGPSPLTVVSLGRWVVAGNTETHTVGLYTTAGVLIESVSIDTTLGTPGSFEYVSLLTPQVLAASTQYVIASNEDAGDKNYNNTGSTCVITTTTDATAGTGAYSVTSGGGPSGAFLPLYSPGQVFGPLDFMYHL